jgi:Acetoacetate decarboxylase (ADC)
MEASYTVRPEMPANDDQFGDEFFQRFRLQPASSPLELTDGIAKTYPFPTLYHDVGCAIGIFLCDYEAACALMPHPTIRPVRMTKGRTLVIFSCYEYRQVLKVWPYNEIAMTIPVLANASFRPPVLPMLLDRWFSRFGYHVFAMPVTSKENQLRGNKLWGLPKITQRIDVGTEGGDSVTTAFEDDGTPYFTLRVPTEGAPTDFDVRGHLYSKLDGRILKAQTCFKGKFAVTKHMRLLWSKGRAPDREYLKIGDGPSAKPLRELGIEPHPFQLRYTQSMNAAFALPIAGFDIDR